MRPDNPIKTSPHDKMSEPIRIEEYTGVIEHKLVAVWQNTESGSWLPTEFMLSQYITRILVVGRSSPSSVTLAADPSWTQVWRSPGSKEWSCLLGILAHMPGPILLVLGNDVPLTPKLVASLKGTMTIVLRSAGSPWPPSSTLPDRVFFPVIGDRSILLPVVQEWVSRSVPRNLELSTLLPQLMSHGYGLMVADGVWHWYKPADSVPMATLTVGQVAKQLQALSVVLAAAN